MSNESWRLDLKYCVLKPWTFLEEEGGISAVLLLFDGRNLETF